MIVKLTKEQIEAIKQIISRSQISGNDAEFVSELKKAFLEAEEEKTS